MHRRRPAEGRMRRTILMLLALVAAHTTFHPTSPAALAVVALTVPTPLIATWVTLQQTGTSVEDGVPEPRCDHSFLSLTGRAQRPNLAIPFPTGATPSTDPYDQVIWMAGGHSDDQFNQTWLLNVSATVPVWRRLHQPSGEDGSVLPRWGYGVALIPGGMEGDDVGLTGIFFAGYNNDENLGDVSSINFASQAQRVVMAGQQAASDSQPFARGYMEWVALPGGAGTSGAINTTVDSGEFYTFGGAGPSTGVRYSAADHDLGDEWIFSLAGGEYTWRRLGQTNCTSNTTVCSDSETLTAVLTEWSTTATPNTPLDFTSSLRPSAIYPAVQNLTAAIQLRNLQPGSLVDNDTTCVTTCAVYGADASRHSPPIAEGARMVVVGNELFKFGGYSCNANGAQVEGGDSCHSNDMWIMNISTLEWRVINPPATDSDFYSYWPSKRCYHALTATTTHIFVEGGAYLDKSGSYEYYNDVTAFSIALGIFVPLTVRGIPPLIHWSAGFQAEGDDLYLFGGCQGASTYSQLLVLKVGLSVEAGNCYASGSGLLNATSDSQATFTIQARESSTYFSATLNSTQTVWGANATYGTGLTLTSQLVASKTPTGSLSLVQAKVVEIGNGEYTVTYTATAGRDFQLFVYYEDDQIPGSPFAMTLAPKPEASPTNTEAQGWGVELAAKGEVATTLVQVRDAYSNDFDDTSFLTSGATLTFTASMGADADTLVALPITVVNNNNGTYTITYDVPSSTADFLLVISLNGEQLSGSPYSVATLNPIKLPNALVSAFWVIAILTVVVCVSSSLMVARYRQQAIIRTASPPFCHQLHLGAAMTALSVVCLTIERDAACQGFHTLLSVGLVACLTAIIAKSHRIARSHDFQLRMQQHLQHHSPQQQLQPPGNKDLRLFIVSSAALLFVLLINVLWIGVNPMRSESVPSSNSAQAAVLFYRTCSSENGMAWVGVLIALCGSLLLYAVYMAVKTGHIPDLFEEAKLLSAAAYNAFVCSVIVVPLLFFIGTSSEFLVGRAVIESLVILWVSLFMVLGVMGPKAIGLIKIHRAGGVDAVTSTLSATKPTAGSPGAAHPASHTPGGGSVPLHQRSTRPGFNSMSSRDSPTGANLSPPTGRLAHSRPLSMGAVSMSLQSKRSSGQHDRGLSHGAGGFNSTVVTPFNPSRSMVAVHLAAPDAAATGGADDSPPYTPLTIVHTPPPPVSTVDVAAAAAAAATNLLDDTVSPFTPESPAPASASDADTPADSPVDSSHDANRVQPLATVDNDHDANLSQGTIESPLHETTAAANLAPER